MLTNSNFYIGDSSISRLYQGDNLVWDSSHPDILLEWIANGADDASANPDVYFDTGFLPQLSTRAEVKFESPTLAVARVFGCGNSATASSMFNLNFYANGPTPAGSNKMSLKFFYRGGAVSAPFTPEINTPYTVSLFGTYSGNTASEINMIVNGTKYTRSVDVQANITDGQSAYIFRWHGNVNEIQSGVKFYYVKIWEANNLIRFYIPVLHYISGQYIPCFYDKVNDTYIYNLGTDTPTYKISGDYLLDYLGTEPETEIPNTITYMTMYDSGVVADTSLATDTRFRLVYGRENFIFGSGTSAQTTPTWQQYSLLCPGNLYRITFNAGSREEGAISAGLIADSSAVYDVHTISTYYEGGMGRAYLDNVLKWSSGFVVSYISSNTIYMFSRHGDASAINAGAGSRIYYINFTISNIPAKTYIPVFHNNQAAFLDLNSGTYIYNLGTATPYYELNR